MKHLCKSVSRHNFESVLPNMQLSWCLQSKLTTKKFDLTRIDFLSCVTACFLCVNLMAKITWLIRISHCRNETSLVNLRLQKNGNEVSNVVYGREYSLMADVTHPDGKYYNKYAQSSIWVDEKCVTFRYWIECHLWTVLFHCMLVFFRLTNFNFTKLVNSVKVTKTKSFSL